MREQLRHFAWEMMDNITNQTIPNKEDTINEILNYFYRCFRVYAASQSGYKDDEDFEASFMVFEDELRVNIMCGDLFVVHGDDVDKIVFDKTGRFCQSTNEVKCDGFVGEVLEGFYKYMRKGAIML